jgi:hypothetical protein
MSQQEPNYHFLTVLRRSQQDRTACRVGRPTQSRICSEARTECLEVLPIECRKQSGHVPGLKKGFHCPWIRVGKLNRVMERVRNIGRSNADSTRKHHLENVGLPLKGGILERRPPMTTRNNELRILEQQSPDRLNLAGLHCALNCQQLFPAVHLYRGPS